MIVYISAVPKTRSVPSIGSGVSATGATYAPTAQPERSAAERLAAAVHG